MPTRSRPPAGGSPRPISSGAAARKIHFLMSTNHQTLPQLAEALRVSRDRLQEVIDGFAAPSTSLLARIARHFGVPPDFITGGSPAPKAAGSPAAAPKGKRARDPEGAGTLRTLASRHQALVELLIEKGIVTAAEFNKRVGKIKKRR